ncbi:MAG: hypothetical protein DYG98_14760 [Haliscomenobacteraceae bacterium CHB4]|nr:hypothetical protein [Saprospiraceae bacterium]MCE7924304.1 hypothetical protein [Haliscomenobacteraceae bacterium CHB4]
MGLTLEISSDQLLNALLQLSADEKIRIAERLKAAATTEKWRMLSQQLPDAPEISMEEIVAEVKAARKQRHQNPK